MRKQVLIAVATIGAVAVALVGIDTCMNYWDGLRGIAKDRLRDVTSIQFDLATLDEALQSLTPVIQRNREVAAELETDIEFMEAELKSSRHRQEVTMAEMIKLRELLRDNAGHELKIGKNIYTREEVQNDLEYRLLSHQGTAKQMKSLVSIIDQRQQLLHDATSRIQQDEFQRIDLAHRADTLNAELRLLQSSAKGTITSSKPLFDEVQTLTSAVEKRLRKLQNLSKRSETKGRIDVELDSRTASEKFDDYLGHTSSISY